jgi:hypothetical protein
VSGSSEGDRGGVLGWLNDGDTGGIVAAIGEGGGKMAAHGGGGAPIIDGEGKSGVAVRLWAANPWVRQSGGNRGPNTVGTGDTIVQTVWLTSGAHTVL